MNANEYAWEDEGAGEQSCADAHAMVGYDGGRWWWDVTVVEPYVSGPYPGTPDFHEYHLGEGITKTEADAKWKAIRTWERSNVREEVYAEEERLMEEEMAKADAEWRATLDARGW